MGKQRKEKLWLIRGKSVMSHHYVLRIYATKPTLFSKYGWPIEGTDITAFCKLWFEQLTNLKLRPGQCIEILGFKVLLPKSRPAKRKVVKRG